MHCGAVITSHVAPITQYLLPFAHSGSALQLSVSFMTSIAGDDACWLERCNLTDCWGLT